MHFYLLEKMMRLFFDWFSVTLKVLVDGYHQRDHSILAIERFDSRLISKKAVEIPNHDKRESYPKMAERLAKIFLILFFSLHIIDRL